MHYALTIIYALPQFGKLLISLLFATRIICITSSLRNPVTYVRHAAVTAMCIAIDTIFTWLNATVMVFPIQGWPLFEYSTLAPSINL